MMPRSGPSKGAAGCASWSPPTKPGGPCAPTSPSDSGSPLCERARMSSPPGAPPPPNAAESFARLAALERRAEEGGGAERVARQHQAGKLTARERVEQLCDPGTFTEID